MTTNDILTLSRAGFTKQEILSVMAREQPQQQQAVQTQQIAQPQPQQQLVQPQPQQQLVVQQPSQAVTGLQMGQTIPVAQQPTPYGAITGQIGATGATLPQVNNGMVQAPQNIQGNPTLTDFNGVYQMLASQLQKNNITTLTQPKEETIDDIFVSLVEPPTQQDKEREVK